MTDTSDISLWLALIAIASLLQTLLLIAVGVVAWRTVRQARETVARFEQRQLTPLIKRVNDTVDDVRDVVARARAIDDDVRDKVDRAKGYAKSAATHAVVRMWPALAIGRAAYTAFASFRRRDVGGSAP